MAEDDSLQALTQQEIAELDAAYRPFPAFGEWPTGSAALDRWDLACERFQVIAAEADAATLERSRTVAMRAAAFDTGAIEGLYSTNRGLTFTVAEQSAAWEQKVEEQGPDARALFEAQLKAFELVLDHATSQVPEISQAWIRRIHEETTAAQETYLVHTPVGTQEQPLPQGIYKTHPNHVRTEDGGVHAYAPVDSTQAEMQRLISELKTDAFEGAHPILQASYAHYAFVAIHPFADGNGRVARALASVFTYRIASVPLLILSDQRAAYFKALAAADHGNAQSFVDFTGVAARDAVELARDGLQTALAPQPEEILHEFDELNRLDPTSRERNEIALELGKKVSDVALGIVEEMDAVSVNLTVTGDAGASVESPNGFRRIPGRGVKSIRLSAATVIGKKHEVMRRVDLFISDDPRSVGSLLLRVSGGEKQSLVLELEDLWPSTSSLAQHRIENLIRRALGDELEQLRDETVSKK